MNREDLITKTINLNDNSSPEDKREEIRKYFHKTFTLYEKLFEVINNNNAYYYKPDILRHPLIFYFGHTATFFINKLVLAKILSVSDRVNAHLESTCAVGVDEMSWDDMNTEHYDWPTLKEVKLYRKQVREVVDQVIRTVPCSMPLNWESPLWTVLMGIEHERIHLETSSVLIRQLNIKDVSPHPLFPVCQESGPAPENDLVEISRGEVHLGKESTHNSYGWDNEYGAYDCYVESFQASKYLVSNQEFLEFVEEKGYKTEQYWSEAGWQWVTYKKAKNPLWWKKQDDGSYKIRLMTQEIDLPWDWPAEINFLEADAFCKWKSQKLNKTVRMPTEEEWYRMRDLLDEKSDQFEWERAPGNLNLEYYASSTPVNMYLQVKELGLYDVVGNVWQWTHTPMYPFKGFEVHPLYDDFTVPTFDNLHNIIKGGSWISTGNEACYHARYAFRQHFMQHAGFRYIITDNKPKIPEEAVPFEKNIDVCIPIHSQYGITETFGIENFSIEVAKTFKSLVNENNFSNPNLNNTDISVLEVGCLGGRTCFEIAKIMPEAKITGIDLTVRLVQVGHRLQDMKTFKYELEDEGDLRNYYSVDMNQIGCDEQQSRRVTLIQNDPCNIYSRLKDFDNVIISEVSRLYDPEHVLKSIHERLNQNGMLMVFCSCDWDENRTPQDNWLGGKKVDGESLTAKDAIAEILHNHFVPISSFDIPKLSQTNGRTMSIVNVGCTAWRKI